MIGLLSKLSNGEWGRYGTLRAAARTRPARYFKEIRRPADMRARRRESLGRALERELVEDEDGLEGASGNGTLLGDGGRLSGSGIFLLMDFFFCENRNY